MQRPASPGIDPVVFWISLVIAVAFVLWGVLATENLAAVTSAALNFVIANFGWVFVLASFGFLAFSVMLALSRYGKVRLGKDDERPEFRTSSWVAMMFSTGMGIGLMFFGVAEPIYHLTTPPHGLAETGTGAAAAILLLSGGLEGLQRGAILSAAPFVLVMIGLCWSILKELRTERVPGVIPEPGAAPEPGRAMSRPQGAPAPQQMAAENPRAREPYRG